MPSLFRRQQNITTIPVPTVFRHQLRAGGTDFDSLVPCYLPPSSAPIQAKHMQARNSPTPPLPSASEAEADNANATSLVNMQIDSRYPALMSTSVLSDHKSSISFPSSNSSYNSASRRSRASTRSSKKQACITEDSIRSRRATPSLLSVASASSSTYSTPTEQSTPSQSRSICAISSSSSTCASTIDDAARPTKKAQYSSPRRSKTKTKIEPPRLEMVQNADGRWEWNGPVPEPDPTDELPPTTTTSRLSLSRTLRRPRASQPEEEVYDEPNAFPYLYGSSNGSYDDRGAPNYPDVRKKSSQHPTPTDDAHHDHVPPQRRRGPRYAEESFLRQRPDPRIVMKETMEREDETRRAKGKKPKMAYEKLWSEKLQAEFERDVKKARVQPETKIQPWQEMYQMGATIYDVRDPASLFLERESSEESGEKKKGFLKRFCSKKKPKHVGISAMNAEDLYDFTGGRLEYLTEYAMKRCVMENDM